MPLSWSHLDLRPSETWRFRQFWLISDHSSSWQNEVVSWNGLIFVNSVCLLKLVCFIQSGTGSDLRWNWRNSLVPSGSGPQHDGTTTMLDSSVGRDFLSCDEWMQLVQFYRTVNEEVKQSSQSCAALNGDPNTKRFIANKTYTVEAAKWPCSQKQPEKENKMFDKQI